MKVAIIGGSGHYGFVLEGIGLRPDIELAAISPGSPGEDIAALVKSAAEAGLRPCVYDSAEALMAEENVDIAAVNPWFCDAARITEKCLARGWNVFSEKPLATDLGQLEALREAWQNSGLALGAMFNLRYSPWFKAVDAAVKAGEIGETRLIHGQKSYRLGRRGMPYIKRATFGGLLPWVGIHAIDWLLHFGGGAVRVSASASEYGNRGHGELETTAAALFELKNGAIGTLSADYLRPDGSVRHDDDRLRVTGTRGMLEAIDGRVYLENDAPRRELQLPPADSVFLKFVDALTEDGARAMAEEAFAATRASLLARQAADEGRTIAF